MEPREYGCRKGCGTMFTSGRLTADHEAGCKALTVYGVDCAGTPWTVLETFDTDLALAALARERAAHRPEHKAFGVYWTDDPEAGDVQDVLEEQD